MSCPFEAHTRFVHSNTPATSLFPTVHYMRLRLALLRFLIISKARRFEAFYGANSYMGLLNFRFFNGTYRYVAFPLRQQPYIYLSHASCPPVRIHVEVMGDGVFV